MVERLHLSIGRLLHLRLLGVINFTIDEHFVSFYDPIRVAIIHYLLLSVWLKLLAICLHKTYNQALVYRSDLPCYRLPCYSTPNRLWC